jgi:hypothetical protein
MPASHLSELSSRPAQKVLGTLQALLTKPRDMASGSVDDALSTLDHLNDPSERRRIDIEFHALLGAPHPDLKLQAGHLRQERHQGTIHGIAVTSGLRSQ